MSAVKASRRRQYKLRWQATLNECITAIAASERCLAATSAAGEIALWSWERGDCQWQLRQEAPLSSLAFSRDDRWLAVGGQGGCLQVYDLAALAAGPIVVPVPGTAWIDRLSWNPAAPQLAFNVNRHTWIWDAAAETVVAELEFADSSVLGLAWHPDGTHLAVCGHTGTKVWDARNWQAEPYLLRVPGASLHAAWSPDGRFLAAGNFDRTLSLLRWSSPPPWLMQGFPAKVRQVAWLPDSQRVAAACAEGIALWQWEGENWVARGVLQGHNSVVRGIAVSNTLGQLASADEAGRVCLWRDAKSPMQILSGPTTGCTGVVWHPQASMLAGGGQAGEVCLWAP